MQTRAMIPTIFLTLMIFGCRQESADTRASDTVSVTQTIQPAKVVDSLVDWNYQTQKIKEKVNCSREISNTNPSIDEIYYGCLLGDFEVLKFFVNKEPNSMALKNIRVNWCDWTSDAGQGIHTGKKQVGLVLDYLVNQKMITSTQRNAFMRNKNSDSNTKNWHSSFEYDKGPMADSRVLTITPLTP